MSIITLFNLIVYYKILSYWLTSIFYKIIYYTDHLVILELYDFSSPFHFDNKNNILLLNFILFLLSFDINIHNLILASIYFLNMIEFYIKIKFYKYMINRSIYLICLHLLMIYFFFDDTSYVSSIIYMMSCFILGLL